jgi:hypothetical protein
MAEEKCKYFTGIPITNSTNYSCLIRIMCCVNGFGMNRSICKSYRTK